MNINDVNRGIHKHKRKKRLGRGPASGHGKTCGRGHKGQGSRSGYSAKPTFEGGRMPLFRRIPKRGFNNPFADVVGTVNVGVLNELFEDGSEVTPDALMEKGLVKKTVDLCKVLGDGELTKKLKVSAHRFSASAKEKIEAAGGEVVVLPGKAPVVKGQKKPPEKRAFKKKYKSRKQDG